jgi:nucleoside-diphosphate-sugar epimerase
VYRITLDARRAKKILGWRPKVSLKDGIKKTLATIR